MPNEIELIEEIAAAIENIARESMIHTDEGENKLALVAEGAAQCFIARITQAIARGEMELPGEELRFYWSRAEQEVDHIALQTVMKFTVEHTDLITHRAGVGIALRQEEEK